MNPFGRVAVQGAACGLMIGATLLIGGRVWNPAAEAAQDKQPAVADVVKARSFEVVDASGKMRATLGMGGGTVALGLADARGDMRAALTVVSDGTVSLSLFDAPYQTRAHLSMAPEKSVGLVLCDVKGKQRAFLGLVADGTPTLGLLDAAENARASVTLTRNGFPVMDLSDATGRTRFAVGVANGPGLGLFDAAGNMRAAIGAVLPGRMKSREPNARPESSLALFGENGNVIWKAP
jgi:hypothetical protein